MDNWTITLEPFDLSATFGFPSSDDAAAIRSAVEGRVSGARLPPISWSPAGSDESPDVVVTVSAIDSEDVRIGYTGAVEIPPYQVDRIGLHWDFSKIFTALLIPRLVREGVVPVHAAVIGDERAVLFPGSSGAGKSSLAFTALESGFPVIASELAFVRTNRVVAANTQMTIDPSAARLLSLDQTTPVMKDGRIVHPLAAIPGGGVAVTRLAFPRVTDAGLRIRAITPRRARMLLYENVISQLPVAQLVAQETTPLGLLPSMDELRQIARSITPLSQLEPVVVEGRPAAVLDFLQSQSSEI